MREAFLIGFAAVCIVLHDGGLTASAAHLHHHGAVNHALHYQQRSDSGNKVAETGMDLTDGEETNSDSIEVECTAGNCSLVSPEEVEIFSLREPVVQEIHISTIVSTKTIIATPTRRRANTRVLDDAAAFQNPTTASMESWLDLDIINEVAQFGPGRDQEKSSADVYDLSQHELELRHNHKPHHLHRRQGGAYQSFALGDSPDPSSTISAAAAGTSDLCPHANGTTFKSRAGISYQVVCNIDFPGHDYPFVKAGSLVQCILRCDALNWITHGASCLAGIFVPSRVNYANDCYLKSSVDHPTFTTFEIHGLVRLSAIKAVTSRSAELSRTQTSSRFSSSSALSDSGTMTASSQVGMTSTLPAGNEPGVSYANGGNIIEPRVASSRLHGPTVNKPTNQYIDIDLPNPITLATNLLKEVVNDVLTNGYDIAPQTGILSLNSTTQSMLTPLKGIPHISRDGGGGGYLNGQHLFVFCDTGSYTAPTAQKDGKFLGFVSSSVAVDTGMNGLNDEPLFLKDGIGIWQSDQGRQRGFAPMTEGELSYNLKMQGGGQRYAIWPEAPILPLDSTRGIIIAPIVFDDVDMKTRVFHFTYTGATLLTITADNKAGPVAERTVAQLFNQDEIEWGCSGGIRSWGPSGVGGTDGYVYLFGNIDGGILLARTTTDGVPDRSTYEYWHGDSWEKDMLTEDSDAFFIEGRFMDVNLLYSPRHLTFIIIYLTTWADNTFYYRYLLADSAVRPHYAPGGEPDSDYVDNIYKYNWSEERVLYQAPKSLSGKYIYAGGVHAGYYGSNDITNGGTRMLLSWTAPTGQKPESLLSEYQIMTAVIDWE